MRQSSPNGSQRWCIRILRSFDGRRPSDDSANYRFVAPCHGYSAPCHSDGAAAASGAPRSDGHETTIGHGNNRPDDATRA